jgi:putative tryptophan/tyrosine transport system substrate-binding protein
MNRREFIALLGSAAAWPLRARAQLPERVRRIGVLMGAFAESDPEGQIYVAALREGLQKLGWNDGRNVSIQTRWGAADDERRRAYAAELVSSKPDIIVAGATSALCTSGSAIRLAAASSRV